MTTKSPTLVFVPGAWHTTQYYNTVIDKLRQAGYAGEVVCCELPSVGAQPDDPAMFSMFPDVQNVEAAIAEHTDKGVPVVLVAHSYGSIVGACALKKFADSGLVKFCNVAGFLLEFGESLIALCGGKPPPLWNRQAEYLLPNDPEEAFYNDLPPEMRKEFASKLTRQSLAVNLTSATFEGWAVVPTIYICCTKDNAIPVPVQDFMVQRAEARGIKLNVERLDSSHSPMLSQPDKLVEIIQGLASQNSPIGV